MNVVTGCYACMCALRFQVAQTVSYFHQALSVYTLKGTPLGLTGVSTVHILGKASRPSGVPHGPSTGFYCPLGLRIVGGKFGSLRCVCNSGVKHCTECRQRW